MHFPLTSLQLGMVLDAARSPLPGVNIEQLVCTVRAPIEAARFQAAWDRTTSRHAALRLSFESRPAWRQCVADQVAAPIAHHDWSHLDLEAREARWREVLRDDRERGLDLGATPLWRLQVFRFAPDEQRILWTLHHAILDGRSFSIVLRDMWRAYDRPEEEPHAPPPPAFREFAEWLAARDLRASEPFWREQLRGLDAPTPLVVDHLVPATTTRLQADVDLALSSAVTARLASLAAEHGFTMNNAVQAAWALLLARYNDAAARAAGDCGCDVVFGVTRACRHSAPDAVGLLINTLPFRVRVDPAMEVAAFLRALRQQWLGLRPHEQTPVAHLRAWTRLPPDQPLVRTLVVFENHTLDEALRSRDAAHEYRLYENNGVPLTLAAYGGESLLLRLSYDPAAFGRDTIQRLLGHLQNLLEGIAANPHARLRDLSLTSPGERAALLAAALPKSPCPPATDHTLPELFAAQVERTPGAIALTCGADSLTYRQLDDRAAELAARLREAGARPNTIVALQMERGLDLLIGLIAILKSGAGYLPIDHATPPDRVAFMLKDSAAIAILDAAGLVILSEAACGARREVEGPGIDPRDARRRTAPAPTHQQKATPPVEHPGPSTTALTRCAQDDLSADDLAYVIYTSGSTGQPKGVEITHRNVTRLFTSTQPWFDFSERDVWTLFHSAAFDFSVWEIWGALLHGGRLVIVPHVVSRSPDAFHALLAREKVTVLNQTPSSFRQLIAADANSGKLSSLRLVIFGGEALEMRSLAPWFARYGDEQPQLVNMYGITETTVHVTYRPLKAGDVKRGSVIGEPLPDLALRILDSRGQPSPVGIPGEIYIAGAGLARGYFNRPELTGERFIPDPFEEYPISRSYRTGDLARRLPDGDIEYLGRLDQQVQVRGFRVELGEIENALAQHPGIREAAVVARDEPVRLVACFVPRGAAPDADSLRQHLARSLPDYMIPSAFVALVAMPLTVNGKLDRGALPEPMAQPSASAGAAPRNDLEREIAIVWCDVLRLESVGCDRSFFDLGGHSLLLLQVHSRLPAGLPVTALFQYPTIRALAEHIASQRAPVRETSRHRGARQRQAIHAAHTARSP